jgi:hypothetical protein
MQKNTIRYSIFVLVAVLFFSCLKENDDNLDQNEKFYLDNPETTAQVKFVHAYTPTTINGLSASTTGLRITVDGAKVNAATNTSSSTNTLLYGGVYPPTIAYAFLSPKQSNVKFTMNRIVSGNFAPIAGDDVFNSTVAFAAGKKYSMFIADPYPTPTTYLIEDKFDEPARDHYGVRFVNLCADAATRFDVVSAKHGLKLFSNVGYKEMKDYVYLTTTSTDTIYLKNAATNAIVSQVNGFLPGTQRVYTFYARGKTGVTGRTPNLTFYTNR